MWDFDSLLDFQKSPPQGDHYTRLSRSPRQTIDFDTTIGSIEEEVLQNYVERLGEQEELAGRVYGSSGSEFQWLGEPTRWACGACCFGSRWASKGCSSTKYTRFLAESFRD
ncbi:hypothetical protein LR48_Vigan10g219400 [Vigna angularis]|uniref:Uncharacterized protein n=1 Tax=Phaseolus angularis TaxID=3914 RepID=A0A0L9VN17_PHAAN|nr:hypothetical protein LR48_Vigan10g219400 [Vigna angularis]